MRQQSLAHQVCTKPTFLLAFGFGSGLLPKAPGTFGTLVGVLFYVCMSHLSVLSYGILTGLFFLAGIYLCDTVSKKLGVHDHSGIVWDEIVGYLLSMIFAPPGWIWPVLGFVFFRLFDIWKPFPISWFDEHVRGGFGIMLDDLLAAIPTCFMLFLIHHWI